ncbi:MAG: hypothetical protein WC943_08840 [Elusimicrobiota bacterium]|jgi:hypothetical protein
MDPMALPSPQPLSSPKQAGTGKKVAIGCLIAFLIAAAAAAALGAAGWRMVRRIVMDYTDTAAAPLAATEFDEEASMEIAARVDRFREALRAGAPGQPLTLTGLELNALAAFHPKLKHLSGKVLLSLSGSTAGAEFSVPLDKAGGIFRGRHLNGKTSFSIRLTDGRLTLFLDSLELRGKPMPEWLMRDLRSKNLAEKYNAKPENAALLSRLDTLEIRDSVLYVGLKNAPQQTPP